MKTRLKFIIYPKFQLTLLFTQALFLLLGFIFIFFQITRSVEKLRQLGVQAHLPPEHVFFSFLQWHAKELYFYVGVGLGVAFLLIMVGSILISHKLAGPIVRLRGYFREIAEGGSIKYDLKFRKGDFFSELPGIINQALSRLK